jgi:4-hydroxy-2-oxoheptanedioate aldolase
MNWIRQRVLSREILSGCWLNLGSCITAEIAANAGFDWLVIDLEHGAGGHDSALHQLQAISGTPTAPLVRVAWNEAPRIKRVLDIGASGAVIPYVTSVAEAKQAVAAMRYPPQGIRGAAGITRAATFKGVGGAELAAANQNVLTVIQIETEAGVAAADGIAAIDGIDVLFIGPLDLSVNLGIPMQFDDPRFRAALTTVSDACRKHGKAAGILLGKPEQVERTVADGYTFIGLGSDGAVMAQGMAALAGAFKPYR